MSIAVKLPGLDLKILLCQQVAVSASAKSTRTTTT